MVRPLENPRLESSPPVDLVVLGAGQPTGYAGLHHKDHHAPDHGSLQWIREAVRGRVETSHFVAGYEVEATGSRLDGFSIEYNPRWRETGSITSLLCAPVSPKKQVLVSYADIVFRANIVERLLDSDSDVAISIDTRWRERYSARTHQDMAMAEKVRLDANGPVEISRDIAPAEAGAEFVGLVRLSPAAMAIVSDTERLPTILREKGSLAELIDWLARNHEISITCHDIDGDWAELNAPQDLARFVLGTKAETLDRLRPLVRRMQIEEQVRFTVDEWTADPDAVAGAIKNSFGGTTVIVRSSARSEDSWTTANAGAYASVPNVNVDNDEQLWAAIEEVIESYGQRQLEDQVLIQPMLTNVIANGVIFTRTLSHGAPYFVVNFDETPGRTDTVTSGRSDPNVLYMHHDAVQPPAGAPSWTEALINGAREVIGLVGYDTLDMEFAVSHGGKIHLLQLRPISVDHAEWAVDDKLVKAELSESVARYRALETPPGYLGSGQPIFGIMPDWNPAEIIGVRPSLLSISLYRYLICDEVWAQQRAECGYCDVRPQPLLVSFAGHPYVNVRASFQSFVPATLAEPLANRLVDHYVARLINEPFLHDKIEFKIAFTCLSFDFYDRARAELLPAGLSEDDIEALRSGLADVTRCLLERYETDFQTVGHLSARYRELTGKSVHALDRACALLEDCRRFGTLPFAHLARAGFVAVTLLRSAVTKGLIDQDFLDRYLGSISTVAKEFVADCSRVSVGEISWNEFVESYGHLRPGTYEISSAAYHDDEGKLLREMISGQPGGKEQDHAGGDVVWPQGAWPRMQAALSDLGVDIDFPAFDRFVRRAIEGREYAKFIFSRNLSHALDDLAEYGDIEGVAREELAMLPIETYFALRAGEGYGRPAEFIRARARQMEPRRTLSRNIELPPLIHEPGQFYAFFYPPSEPNFITSLALTRELYFLASGADAPPSELAGRIVVISHADPGYDWLFGCNIAGIITQYGGANSHMAIRSAEFGTPAAIGVGEVKYQRLQHASLVNLDCLNRRIEIIR